jgi:hypothetical protein
MLQIEDIVNQLRAEGNKIDDETLSHVTRLIRKRINPFGWYRPESSQEFSSSADATADLSQRFATSRSCATRSSSTRALHTRTCCFLLLSFCPCIVTRHIILGVCSLSMRYVDASYFHNRSTSIRCRRSRSIPVRASSRSVLRRDR